MDHSTFIAIVADHAGIQREGAERATRATLAERLTAGQAGDVASELPAELRSFLEGGEAAERFGVHEFVRRIAARQGVPVPTAARHARAVFTALGRAISRREQEDMAAQLPTDFRDLLEALDPAGAHIQPPPPEELAAGDFVQRLADRLGVDRGVSRYIRGECVTTLITRSFAPARLARACAPRSAARASPLSTYAALIPRSGRPSSQSLGTKATI